MVSAAVAATVKIEPPGHLGWPMRVAAGPAVAWPVMAQLPSRAGAGMGTRKQTYESHWAW